MDKKKNGRPSTYEMQEMIANVAMSRQKLINDLLDPRRSIDDEAGYPRTEALDVDEYKSLYEREGVATRVVEVMPQESWKVQPSIFETEDVDQETEFEVALETLANSLRGESWFTGEESNPIWELLLRADILSGIGSFGVILLGLDDGKKMIEPAEKATGQKLLFARAFDESLVKITRFVTDVSDPRFGQPEQYSITFSDPRENRTGGVSVPNVSEGVHWTRVIHIADNVGSSEVFGIPRMRPVYNRLYDLKKLYGGSAEMYWRGAFPGISFESHPSLGGDVGLTDDQKTKMRDEVEQYQNTLQRYLISFGMSVKSLAPQVVDPTPQIDTQIEAICIAMAIPKRIFTGSERGELASSQDAVAWNSRVKGRQNTYVTPRIISPFHDRLITLSILPEPQEGYNVVWPDLGATSEDEQATIAVKKTDAMAKYVQGGVEAIIEPLDFFTRILGMSDDEAKEVLEAAMDKLKDDIEKGLREDPALEMERETAVKDANLKVVQDGGRFEEDE